MLLRLLVVEVLLLLPKRQVANKHHSNRTKIYTQQMAHAADNQYSRRNLVQEMLHLASLQALAVLTIVA